jgi:hypothetical protein
MNHPEPAPPRRITRAQALIIAAAVLVFAALSTVLLGAATRVVACSACHSMRPYETAHAGTGHASIECDDCHASRGVLGLPADGVRAIRWIVREPFVDSVEPVLLGDASCRRCHETMIEEVLVSSVRVRHSDFEETPCGTCHGGTAHPVAGRWHIGPQMEDCLNCHRVSLNNVGACDVCHPAEATSASRERPSAWRASHGPGWEQAHGMGDLSGCPACHAPSTCEACHGVGLPHPAYLAARTRDRSRRRDARSMPDVPRGAVVLCLSRRGDAASRGLPARARSTGHRGRRGGVHEVPRHRAMQRMPLLLEPPQLPERRDERLRG